MPLFTLMIALMLFDLGRKFKSYGYMLGAGLALGFVASVRPFSAAGVALPFAVDALLRLRRNPRTLPALAAGASVPLARRLNSPMRAGVMYAPVVPAINDHELEAVLEAAAAAGATTAGYVLLRLPGEVKDLFFEWLDLHFPDRAQKVRNRIRELRGGRDNDPRFGSRMSGTGNFAELIEKRFDIACRKFGLNKRERDLDTTRFKPPAGPQLQLF